MNSEGALHGVFLDFGTEETAATAKSTVAVAPSVLSDYFKAIVLAEKTRDSGGNALLVLDTIAPFLSTWNIAVRWAEEARESRMNADYLSVQRRAYFGGLLERTALLLNNGSLTILAAIETDAFKAVGFNSSASDLSSLGGLDTEQVYELSEFQQQLSASNLERLRRLVERGVPLTQRTLARIDVPVPKAEASEDQKAMRELQSLSDGQVVLSAEAAAAQQFPAMHAGATFSRFGLGSREGQDKRPQRDVRPPALQAVAAHLRMELALQEESRFRPPSAAESQGERTQDAFVARMAVIRAALQQPPRAPLSSEEMTAVLLAASGGSLDSMPSDSATAVVRGGANSLLVQHLRENVPQLLEHFRNRSVISEKIIRELDVAVRLFAALQQATLPN